MSDQDDIIEAPHDAAEERALVQLNGKYRQAQAFVVENQDVACVSIRNATY